MDAAQKRNDITPIAISTGAGALVGAAAGYKFAPSALKGFTPEVVLNNRLERDVFRAKIDKTFGQTMVDAFNKVNNGWKNIAKCSIDHTKNIFHAAGAKYTDKQLTGKQLKEVLDSGKIIEIITEHDNSIVPFKEAISKMDDETKYTFEHVNDLVRDTSPVISENWNAAKKSVGHMINKAPKLSGKFAVGLGIAGAAAGLMIGGIVSAVSGKSKPQAS